MGATGGNSVVPASTGHDVLPPPLSTRFEGYRISRLFVPVTNMAEDVFKERAPSYPMGTPSSFGRARPGHESGRTQRPAARGERRGDRLPQPLHLRGLERLLEGAEDERVREAPLARGEIRPLVRVEQPHFAQKRRPSRFSCWHCGHCIRAAPVKKCAKPSLGTEGRQAELFRILVVVRLSSSGSELFRMNSSAELPRSELPRS